MDLDLDFSEICVALCFLANINISGFFFFNSFKKFGCSSRAIFVVSVGV